MRFSFSTAVATEKVAQRQNGLLFVLEIVRSHFF